MTSYEIATEDDADFAPRIQPLVVSWRLVGHLTQKENPNWIRLFITTSHRYPEDRPCWMAYSMAIDFHDRGYVDRPRSGVTNNRLTCWFFAKVSLRLSSVSLRMPFPNAV